MDGMKDPANDRGSRAPTDEPDPYGRAALFLAESILHTLVERGLITAMDAESTLQTAAEVKRDVAEHENESSVVMNRSLSLLSAIRKTFAGYSP